MYVCCTAACAIFNDCLLGDKSPCLCFSTVFQEAESAAFVAKLERRLDQLKKSRQNTDWEHAVSSEQEVEDVSDNDLNMFDVLVAGSDGPGPHARERRTSCFRLCIQRLLHHGCCLRIMCSCCNLI
jgi:hypothetical protein